MHGSTNSYNNLLVSVIIPTYNSAAYIAEAVESVLAQTYPNIEIIVVDDGSTDDTATVIAPYRSSVIYINQANRGVSAARNIGMRQARGQLIAFLDADDIWMPGKLERQVKFLARHKNVGLVFGDAELFDVKGTVTSSFLRRNESPMRLYTAEVVLEDTFKALLVYNFICTCTVVITRACMEQVGGFDESLQSVEDRDLWLRIAGCFSIGCIPELMSRKRVHGHNLSSDGLLALQSYIRVIEQARSKSSTSAKVDPTFTEAYLASLYLQLGYIYFDLGRHQEARQNFLVSLTKRISTKPLVYYVATFFGERIVMWARRLKQLSRQGVFSVSR